jgi:hypothetical protein
MNGSFAWQTTWNSGSLGAGAHTIEIVHHSGQYIDVDAFEVTAAP